MFTGDWYSDSAIMIDILDQVKFYSGTERKKMLYTKSANSGSMLYGTTWKGHLSFDKDGNQIYREKDKETGLYKTKVYSEYPELKEIFKEYSKYHFPNFSYSQVQMNKNYPCPPHFDSLNIGESILCCYGDYLDGETCLYNEKTRQIEMTDARKKPFKFDGSKILHWVKPPRARGNRYSLVFFHNHKK
jgi:hypothetical protein